MELNWRTNDEPPEASPTILNAWDADFEECEGKREVWDKV